MNMGVFPSKNDVSPLHPGTPPTNKQRLTFIWGQHESENWNPELDVDSTGSHATGYVPESFALERPVIDVRHHFSATM